MKATRAAQPAPAPEQDQAVPDALAPEATTSEGVVTVDLDDDTQSEARRGKEIRGSDRPSSVMASIRNEEELSLKEMLDSLGVHGAFKVAVRRTEPTAAWDPSLRRNVTTGGYLDTFDHPIDEAFLQMTFGGGTYSLRVSVRGPDGSFKFQKGMHRTVKIAGDPRFDRLPGQPTAPPAAPGAPATVGDSVPLAMKAFDMMKEMAERREGETRDMDPTVRMMLDQLSAQAAAKDLEIAAMRRELAEQRNVRPLEDPIKDKLLNSLVDGQSGHVTALQLRHEAEIRQLKEGFSQDIKRIEDRHDRAMDDLRRTHDSALATIKTGFEREIAAMRQLNEVVAVTNKGSHDIQKTVLEGERNRLQAEVDRLTIEVKDLRDRKDKPILEQFTELTKLRDALTEGGGEDKSFMDKIGDVLTNPDALAFAQGIFGKKPEAVPAQQAQQVPAAPIKPTIARAPNGEYFAMVPDGKGGMAQIPVKHKAKVVPKGDGTMLELPVVDQARITMLVGYLERAFAAGQEPDVVAQSGRTTVPDEILSWIRQNDNEAQSGVDLFMSQVAKLPGSSPLATQAGRNWLRKVGKALIE